MEEKIVHDPKFARLVYAVYAEIGGRTKREGGYYKWLRRYVKPLAAIVGEFVIMNHGGSPNKSSDKPEH